MTHLGERVSALIDGELGHQERERALAHLTFCAECRAEVDGLRALKSRLRAMEPPSMPTDLTMSLLALSEGPGRAGPLGQLPGMYSVAPMDNRPPQIKRTGRGASGPGRSAFTSSGPRRSSRRAGYVAVGMASAAVALGTFFIVGGDLRPANPPEMIVPARPTSVNAPTPYVRNTPTPTPSPSSRS